VSDPRLTLIRDGVASLALEGLVPADRYAEPIPMHCAAGTAPLRAAPDPTAQQDDQLIFGEAFDVLSEDGPFVFGQARRDGYVGYVSKAELLLRHGEPTHWVNALRTFAFSHADLKSAPVLTLTLNSLVTVEEREGLFARIAGSGWVFAAHLAEVGQYETDPAAIATWFLGAPYLWGGRDSTGLDCSGLVQQALYACGQSCPRDTDLQEQALGHTIPPDALTRNHLVFWRGHVGIMLDETNLLHANAHHMAVEIEPLADAIARIEGVAGRPTAYKRLNTLNPHP
jgi:hypothetical protein